MLRIAVTEGAGEGLRHYLEQNETRQNTIVHNGQTYQFNRTSKKEIQSPFSKIVLERRLYQNENGESFGPLDHAWNMENQFATSEVRDAVLFAMSLMPAGEARQLFDKCSTFNLTESTFKKIAENLGPDLEERIDDFLETIRQDESIPSEETKVVNVLVREQHSAPS